MKGQGRTSLLGLLGEAGDVDEAHAGGGSVEVVEQGVEKIVAHEDPG